MDKESGHYCYEPYSNKINSTGGTLKRDQSKPKKKEKSDSCSCFGNKKSKRKAFLTGLITNMGICVLLFGYTLIGSVIFLAIEGGGSVQHQILATTSMSTNHKRGMNTTGGLKVKNDKAREKTVENIWDITVSLNILYRDNWTRLAAQEITRFQDELLKSLAEEMAHQQPVKDRKRLGKVEHAKFEWTFAKSFLYSLTVLTTIGKLKIYSITILINIFIVKFKYNEIRKTYKKSNAETLKLA